jgi:hypothetical protein
MNYENFKDAKYPCAGRRMELALKYREAHNLQSGDPGDAGYRESQHDMRHEFDKYLFRQYYLRDQAVELLEAGKTNEAIEVLKQIGE